MTILNNLISSVSCAAETAAAKTREISESAIISSRIFTEEKRIENLYKELGRAVYMQSIGKIEGDISDLCDKITISRNNILTLKQRHNFTKNH